ncbi:protein Cep78 homolog [Topomyia yanbarensis]|uniref:protein Cep78 homolog n=1 Tax=Topomyia yanbarensis TaxID=2498891 RepID=UPI00273CC299|nr:protein Cep78 homolog [Topomyia yanbarensis]
MTKGKRENGVNRRCRDFHRRYLALCRAKNLQPLPQLTVTGSGGGTTRGRMSKAEQQVPSLNFYGDRFKECDWLLIIDALLEDTSLEIVAIRLRKVLSDVLDSSSHRMDLASDRPAVLTKRLFSQLIDSLGQFLVHNQVVRVFILEALPVQGIHMATLVNGLQQNCSITDLSFARSTIRDDGCESVCSAVMHLPKIESLNLSACHLTARGCHAVAELIKYQKIQRFAQSWQYSLRYGDIDTNKMQGLRNVLLSGNPYIGDEGLIEISEVLKDDEWIRQVHFRNCGLTDMGAKSLVDCLNMNKTIEKFDIRANLGISNEACHEMLIRLGVELESSDSSQSFSTGAGTGGNRMKTAEQIKFLQQQLAAERHRNTQLQLMVEQMHLQQTECAAQLNKLKHDFNQIVEERDELLNRQQHMIMERPKSRRSIVRKSKSEALPKPSQLFSQRRTAIQHNGRSKSETKSEIVLRTVRDRHAESASAISRQPKRHHMLERTIGDSGLTGQLNDIAELNEELDAVQKSFTEGGCGDMGIGCSNIKVSTVGQYGTFREGSRRTRVNDETSDEDYFVDIGEAADQWSTEKGIKGYTNGGVTSCDEDDDDDLDETSANSFSGADLLKMIVRKRSAEHVNDAQSMFTSVYSREGH